jgi:TetR/AcrR family transcriptional regulator, fatty acid metabolism regulator protein
MKQKSQQKANKPSPPGKLKIMDSLRKLLEKKEFGAITTAEIAKQAGVTEALIYKYFKDKRDLLHQVLREYLEDYMIRFGLDLKGIKGSLNKLRKIIWVHFHTYSSNRVFARILLIEVRNHQDYYLSETYKFVRQYANMILNIVEEGVENGEIRDDIPARMICQGILGSIEHICLTRVVFGKGIEPDVLADDLCELIFSGIAAREK